MLKLIKQWFDEWNDVQQELAEMGIFQIHTLHGSFLHYIDPQLSTHINTADDKLRSIPEKDCSIKE